jgi:hypothetical protein
MDRQLVKDASCDVVMRIPDASPSCSGSAWRALRSPERVGDSPTQDEESAQRERVDRDQILRLGVGLDVQFRSDRRQCDRADRRVDDQHHAGMRAAIEATKPLSRRYGTGEDAGHAAEVLLALRTIKKAMDRLLEGLLRPA